MGINIELSKEDKLLIELLYDKYNKGIRINSVQLTDLYNRVFNKNEKVVNCGTCLRNKLFDLVKVNTKDNKDRLTEDDILFLKWTKTLDKDIYPDFDKIIELYNRVFKLNEGKTGCLICINQMLNQLYKLL